MPPPDGGASGRFEGFEAFETFEGRKGFGDEGLGDSQQVGPSPFEVLPGWRNWQTQWP